MKRPVLPLEYAAINLPLRSNTRWTGGLEPIPATQKLDGSSLRSGATWSYLTTVEPGSEAEITIMPVVEPGEGAASGGVPTCAGGPSIV